MTPKSLDIDPLVLEDDVEPVWHTLGDGGPRESGTTVAPRRLLAQLVAGTLVVLLVIGVGASLAARRLAEREAVADAVTQAGVLADAVVSPALSAGLLAGRPAAVRRFDRVVRAQVLAEDVVRVKLWAPGGRVVYADEPQLVGRTFALDGEQQEALDTSTTQASISDLSASENTFDGTGRLVEVYRPIGLPDGRVGLFEIYTSYDPVTDRTSMLWKGFLAIMVASLVGLLALLGPLLWHLFSRVRRHERQRAALLERAVDAGAAERRRIAASLHDGPVQELAATSFTVAGAAAQAQRAGAVPLAGALDEAASSVRSSIRSLRTLLTDIYPSALVDGGLVPALEDLAQTATTADVRVSTDLDPAAEQGLDEEQRRRLFRLAQESVRNAVGHAGPGTVTVRLSREAGAAVVDVVDDGAGFDVEATLADPRPGHLGLRILADLADAPGLSCQVSSRVGCGTHVRVVQQVAGSGAPTEPAGGQDG
ncbi:sensor histidine kinase [Nocardioides marmoribigeumensis]|uniref:Signal transduction histidine kinase n=1 Tax=Nocardioides marmoribigeumensis TaxID=433649 RepID=A0ABU2BSF7_9ACTN|nr:histidine kinase [Nocardioides marmoribigeumensis]MDR7361561.1 signal transduction histidine kinase [Nocardioides marmoribigeumensis]